MLGYQLMSRELKYYGIHSCLRLAEKRAQDIIRVYLDTSNVKTFSFLLKWCAKERKPYHIIPQKELDKVSGSIHHEGVCILARELPFLPTEVLERELLAETCLLYLDGVENPHNFGSILRTAAHFAIPYILSERFPLTPSACRVAKGGAELVRLIELKRPLDTLKRLKISGFSLIAASAHHGESLHRFRFPPRTILAIGSESMGLKNVYFRQARSVHIPGTGEIESLNVSVAAALCIGGYRSQYGM